MNLTDTVWQYYEAEGRHDMPWRQPEQGLFDPYKIMVSEIMLQQTQVSRVIPKYHAFLGQFPSIHALADAPLADVLLAWSGLGYNRRAKFLHQAAQMVVRDYNGTMPRTKAELVTLPGIGPNTAGAIMAYAYNSPEVFIETNIRSIFIHHYFPNDEDVTDAQLLPFITAALNDLDNEGQTPRTWYWALMDYGTYLKQQAGNASRRSRTFTKQSTFKGSRRQIRGMVIKALAQAPHSFSQLEALSADDRLVSVLDDLAGEGMISLQNKQYHLGSVA